jgi:hypothetical protein
MLHKNQFPSQTAHAPCPLDVKPLLVHYADRSVYVAGEIIAAFLRIIRNTQKKVWKNVTS